ncbi:MAG: hypothetical protein FD123_1008 [Bacteroidetes bacterium]|nr:MAG: hypothetical protein FD123_1008 [Bacteroidota bacterium]
MKPIFYLLCFLLLESFTQRGTEETNGPIPDYTQQKFWIALPDRHDIGDTIPPGCSIPENQANAKVDVFYIHPTVYLVGGPWNASLDDEKVNGKSEMCVKNQATPFNACGKVYAPRYRQAHLKAFTRGGPEGEAALDLAYSDIKKAFEYYLEHWNKGRPVIIAGHSQGAKHTQRLLKEFFDGKPLQKQLVAAYPIGFSIPVNDFKNIPVGDSATQTGCFVSWNTVYWGQQTIYAYTRYKGCACVNPVSWKQATATVPSAKHQGGVKFEFENVDTALCETKVHDNLLWVKFSRPLDAVKYWHTGTNYHVSDVNLFYMDIRKNAVDRTNAYLKKNGL